MTRPDTLVEGVDNLVVCQYEVRECGLLCGNSLVDPGIVVQLLDEDASKAEISHVIPGSFPKDADRYSTTAVVRAEGKAVNDPWEGGKQATFAVAVRPSSVGSLSLTFEVSGREQGSSNPDAPTSGVTVNVGPRPDRRLNEGSLALLSRKRAKLVRGLAEFFEPGQSAFRAEFRDAVMHVGMMGTTMLASKSFGSVLGIVDETVDYLWQTYTDLFGSPFKGLIEGSIPEDRDNDGVLDVCGAANDRIYARIAGELGSSASNLIGALNSECRRNKSAVSDRSAVAR